MISLSAIMQFINERKSSRVFGNWDINTPEHRLSVINAITQKLAFYSTDDSGRVDGFGMVSTADFVHFHVNQFIALRRDARRRIIAQFLKYYPNAIVTSYDRRGSLRQWHNFNRLIQHFINA